MAAYSIEQYAQLLFCGNMRYTQHNCSFERNVSVETQRAEEYRCRSRS